MSLLFYFRWMILTVCYQFQKNLKLISVAQMLIACHLKTEQNSPCQEEHIELKNFNVFKINIPRAQRFALNFMSDDVNQMRNNFPHETKIPRFLHDFNSMSPLYRYTGSLHVKWKRINPERFLFLLRAGGYVY